MRFSGSAGRAVFTKTRRDPEATRRSQKKRLKVDSAPGKDPEALAKEVLAGSKDVIERMEKFLAN